MFAIVIVGGGTNVGTGVWKFGSGLSSRLIEYFTAESVPSLMKTILPLVTASLILTDLSPAQPCREVVRDSSGRVVQTIYHQKSSGGTVRSVIRDASGRTIGTSTSQTSAGGHTRTTYRDASGRMTGAATTNGSSTGSSRTTYRDASGRMTGSTTSRTNGTRGSRTNFRDAAGRSTGSQTTNGPSGFLAAFLDLIVLAAICCMSFLTIPPSV